MGGQGTYHKKENIYSALVGKIEKTGKILSVTPLSSRFFGESGDVVIGRVLEIANKKWLIDVQGCTQANLHLNSVMLEHEQRRKTE